MSATTTLEDVLTHRAAAREGPHPVGVGPLMATVFSFTCASFAVSSVRWLVLVLASRRATRSSPSSVPVVPGSVGA